MISASRRVEVPSRHRCASSPGEQAVGGFFFDFEPIRTASVAATRRRPAQSRMETGGPPAPRSSERPTRTWPTARSSSTRASTAKYSSAAIGSRRTSARERPRGSSASSMVLEHCSASPSTTSRAPSRRSTRRRPRRCMPRPAFRRRKLPKRKNRGPIKKPRRWLMGARRVSWFTDSARKH